MNKQQKGMIVKNTLNTENISRVAATMAVENMSLEDGMDPQILKTILGHSKIAITLDLYGHVLPDTKVDVMNKIKIAV